MITNGEGPFLSVPGEEPALSGAESQLDDAHGLSIGVAESVRALRALRTYGSSEGAYSDIKLTHGQARTLAGEVIEVCNTHFGGVPAEIPGYDDTRSDLGRAADRVEAGLRRMWHEQYYQPRTRAAEPDDFQEWLDGYVEAYGEPALSRTASSDVTFEGYYRRSQGEAPDSLRVATEDLRLIPAVGWYAVSVIAPDGITVENVLPRESNHNRIYGLDTPPQEFGTILVPSDIESPEA